MKRRGFLTIASVGCGAVALVGLGRAGQVGLLSSDESKEAWREVGSERGLRAIVAAGVLAANPHDSQPWRFRLGESRIDLHLDPARALGPVDPFLRQMHLGIGCALENLVVGAAMAGLAASIDLFPDSNDATLAARLSLSRTAAPASPHAGAIARRHTNRGPYDPTRPVTAQVGAALGAQVREASTSLELFDATSARGRAFAGAIVESTEALIEDDVFMRATDAWFRWTPREVVEHRDGPALDCAGLSPLKRVAAQLGPRPSEASFRSSWLDSTREVHLATAPTFGVIAVRDPSRAAQLVEAGRLYQRIHLEATLRGIAMQPLDQRLELVDRARQRGLAAPGATSVDLAPRGFVPIMMFRAGTPLRAAPPSARRSLDEVLFV
jgi:hypothetical protein